MSQVRCLSPSDFMRLPENNQDEIMVWLEEHGHTTRATACIRAFDGRLVLDCYRLDSNGRPLIANGAAIVDEVEIECRRPFPWPGPMLRLQPLHR